MKAYPSSEFAIIERIARIVSSVRGIKSDYASLAAELEQAVSFDVFGVVLLRHDRQALRITTCERGERGWVAYHHQHPLADSKLERLLKTRTLTVQDYPTGLDGPPAESGDALLDHHELHSTLIVPLMAGDQVLGSLELGSTVPHIYANATTQRLVDAVAQVLATAIESVQLGGNTAIQDRQRRVLKSVTSALTEKMDLSAILKQIVTGISEALNVASCICLWDRSQKCLRLEAQSGLGQEAVNEIFASGLPISETCILGRTLLWRKSFVSNDIINDERYPTSQAMFRRLGLRSILSSPLVTGETVHGVLFLCSPETGGFTPLKSDILALFANQASIAIHNGLLLESVQQRSRFRQAIEQLELVYRQHNEAARDDTEALQEELFLLKRVREETQKTFGVSFSSFLHFIGDYLLTPGERALQDQSAVPSDTLATKLAGWLQPGAESEKRSLIERLATEEQIQGQATPFAQSLSLLAQTARSALERAGLVGELGRLLTQLKQSTGSVHDSWFVIALNGTCLYMNPAAEVLCNIRLEGTLPALYSDQSLPTLLEQRQSTAPRIVDVFCNLLPRIRNSEEVISYLHNFEQEHEYHQEIRCILAAGPIPPHATQASAQTKPHKQHPRQESTSPENHYQLTRYPLYDQQGQLAAHALHVQDITEQVRDEKNRSALLSSVSHDLRTPLTTIKVAVSGLLQAGLPWSKEDLREMLEDVDRETDHLTVLVNAWVELSRIEMGALVLEREWCDILEIFHGARTKASRILAGRQLCLHNTHPLSLIYADHVQLERVFYNLLENACQHSFPDSTIDIYIAPLDDGVKKVAVRVIDYGDGVPEHEQELLFKSFYTPRSYGNGMGLAICRGIIEAHQGKIWLDQTHTPGACFMFTLPTHAYTAGVSTDKEDQETYHVDENTLSNEETYMSRLCSPLTPANMHGEEEA